MERQDDFGTDTQSGLTKSDGEMASRKPRFAGLYREDVVQSSRQPGVMGMVIKVAGDSESSSSDGESDDGAESILEGCARVCWTNLQESTEKIECMRVMDRAFLHGDIVAAVSSPLGQIGTVINVELKVDLELSNGEFVKGIDSKKIKRIRSFEPGDYVIHEHWLGRVDEVDDNVTVLFDDGSKCNVIRADPERLCPLPMGPVDDTNCPFYPGQRVRASSSALFKSARWLKGTWKANRVEGIVTNVEVGSVMVYWIAAAHTGYNSQPAAIPSEQQDPKSLKRMPDLSYTSWQLGDRALVSQSLGRKFPVIVQHTHDGPHSECEEIEYPEVTTLTQEPTSSDLGTYFTSNAKDASFDGWVTYRKKFRKGVSKHKKKSLKKHDPMETAALIVGTKTKVDVLWQDGMHGRGVDSCTLFPVDHLGDHDFWPEQYVLEKGADFEGVDPDSKRVGIVKSVDAKQRTAKVKWLLPFDRPEGGLQFEAKEDIVSVYELVEHPDYSYSIGDVVIRLCLSDDVSSEAHLKEADTVLSSNSDEKSRTGGNASMENEHKGDHENALEKSKIAEGKVISTDYAWVGLITGLHDGDIKVAWADGNVSKVGPQAIFVVGRDDDESSEASDVGNLEDVDDTGSWTTVESTTEANEEQELGQSDLCNDLGHNGSSDGGVEVTQREKELPAVKKVSHGLGSALTLPFAALIRALWFVAGLLCALRYPRRTSHSELGFGNPGAKGLAHGNTGLEILPDESNGSVPESSLNHTQVQDNSENVVTDEHTELVSHQGIQSGVSSKGSKSASDSIVFQDKCTQQRGLNLAESSCVFKQFDSVKDFSGHHFASEVIEPSNQKRWSKKIQKEWVMLEKSLPDSIYVRVYEDRMDLLRTVIIGAAGTPYHDGLFFFDLHMPSDYPMVPPLVHYHSGGLRLNPNLYETGKVCLSLLNTWTGKGNEIWHPSTSSILQVLISIQGLVLNANPYFNEAGYDRQMGTAEGEKNSLAYTENSFLLSCKSMLYLIRRPPKHFEGFVKEHFKRRGPSILLACNLYLKGYPVGQLPDYSIAFSLQRLDPEQTSTTGFKIMLSKSMPRLVAAFEEIGADVKMSETS